MNTIIITIPNTFGKPTIIRYERDGRGWNRYWNGYDSKGCYVHTQDRQAKGGPEQEVAWASANGFTIERS